MTAGELIYAMRDTGIVGLVDSYNAVAGTYGLPQSWNTINWAGTLEGQAQTTTIGKSTNILLIAAIFGAVLLFKKRR